jgi:hypothetical protein
VIEPEGDVSISIDGISQKYKVTCKAKGSTAGLQDATVDVHFKVKNDEVVGESLEIKII